MDGVDSMGGMVDRGNHGGTVVEDLPDQDRYGEYKKGCNLQEGRVTRRKLRASLAYQFRDHGAGCELKLNCEESRVGWMLYRSVPVRCLYAERTTFRRGTTGGEPRGGKELHHLVADDGRNLSTALAGNQNKNSQVCHLLPCKVRLLIVPNAWQTATLRRVVSLVTLSIPAKEGITRLLSSRGETSIGAVRKCSSAS